ncbi:MAG: GntR family transcriptional regulator [Acetivibrionales bacterium]|jgi:DNA-binding GntR family transcriptional regulator
MQHLSLKQRAYKIIKEKMFNGEFEPGSRIREDLLAEEISMSRTPVREAINQLSAEGLVKNIPRKGIYFISFSTEEIVDLLDVRESLEVLAVSRCIEKIKPEQLQRLRDNLDEFEFMLSQKKYKECNELDSSFHREIAAISDNSKLIEYLSEIEDIMLIARTVEKKESPESKNKLTLKEHSKILDCISNADKTGAVKAVKENIERMKKNLGINQR